MVDAEEYRKDAMPFFTVSFPWPVPPNLSLQIEVLDYSTIGEMMLKVIEEANNFF